MFNGSVDFNEDLAWSKYDWFFEEIKLYKQSFFDLENSKRHEIIVYSSDGTQKLLIGDKFPM